MITQQQPDRVSNPLRSNAWTLLYRRNESKSPLEPLLNRRLVNCSAHIFDFLHGFIRRSNKAKAYRISSGFILRILITSRLHCICKDVTPYLLSLLKCHCHWWVPHGRHVLSCLDCSFVLANCVLSFVARHCWYACLTPT